MPGAQATAWRSSARAGGRSPRPARSTASGIVDESMAPSPSHLTMRTPRRAAASRSDVRNPASSSTVSSSPFSSVYAVNPQRSMKAKQRSTRMYRCLLSARACLHNVPSGRRARHPVLPRAVRPRSPRTRTRSRNGGRGGQPLPAQEGVPMSAVDLQVHKDLYIGGEWVVRRRLRDHRGDLARDRGGHRPGPRRLDRRHRPGGRRRPQGVRRRSVAAHVARSSGPRCSPACRPRSRPGPRTSPTRSRRENGVTEAWSLMGQVFSSTMVLDTYVAPRR